MSFPHEVIAAWPTPGAGDPDRELIRAMTTRRFAYCLSPNENVADFVAKDPVSGVPPLNLIKGGTLFAYDETDTTTAPSDVCLVTYDNCRYKSGAIEPPYSVTSRVAAQPADVDASDGDRLLLLAGVTGPDFAGKAGQIAIRKGVRWYFAVSPIGRRLYVEVEDAYYYRNASGVWTAGNGSIALAANSVRITNVLGAKASFVVKVENQTTNAPPASPIAPVAYIIGPSPTGAWAGKAGQLAYCLSNGIYTYIVPDEGDEVWDKDQNNKYVFDGVGWNSASGAIVKFKPSFLAASTAAIVVSSGSAYSYNPTVAPSGAVKNSLDTNNVAYAARKAGALLRITWQAAFIADGSNRVFVSGVTRDAVSGALDWLQWVSTQAGGWFVFQFYTTTADTLSHTYYCRVWDDPSSFRVTSFSRSLITIEEFA